MSYQTIRCATGSEFLAAISPWHVRWWSAQRRSRPELTHMTAWWFRGQANAEWGLTPSAFRRDAYASHPLAAAIRDFPAQALPQMTAATEWMRLRDFVRAADSQGVYLPEDSYRLRGRWFCTGSFAEVYSLVNSSGGGAWPPEELLPLTAFAQHHGIPTRLLDWSRSPFVAAYFAAASAIECEEIGVWALDSIRGNRRGDIEFIELPLATNSNMVRQKGVFTLQRSEPPMDLDEIEWEHADDEAQPLVKVTAPASERPYLLGWLSAAGFDRATLMTGGNAVAEHVLKELEVARMAGPIRT